MSIADDGCPSSSPIHLQGLNVRSLLETPQILRAPATLPPGIRIYAIGDIHGRADFLRIMLEKVDADRRQRLVDRPILLFIGDYVDRGPSSKEVLDILLEYRGSSESMF